MFTFTDGIILLTLIMNHGGYALVWILFNRFITLWQFFNFRDWIGPLLLDIL
jgi:hypothetical protein